MLLHRLLDALPGARVSGPADVEIVDVAYDSRKVGPGSLFVAVPSVGGDGLSGGRRFIPEAVARGAVAVVTQVDGDVPGATAVRVPDARAALADLASAFFGHPSERLQLFAVTGTDGKTTSTYLLEQILASAGFRTGLMGTVEVKVGERREANLDRMTTPESLDVQRLLKRMVDAGVTHVALEASSHALALQRLRGCRLAACAVTNITADHVEFHGSWEAYFAAKASLFADLGRGCPAVLNRDDEHFELLAERVTGPLLTYGLSSDADIQATDIRIAGDGFRCLLRARDEEVPLHLPLPGRFNLANALAATGLALVAGLPLETIARALATAVPPPGRLQRVTAGQPFEVVVDYAHTVHAFRSVLAALRERAEGRLIVVFGATGSRDRAKRPVLGRIARQYADFSIITNEDPYGEPAGAIMDEIAAGLPAEEEGVFFRRVLDRGEAIRLAVAAAAPGDVVAILGKGHERSIVVNGHKEPWSDLAAAQQALEAAR